MPPGRIAPYQVRLASGELMCVPMDEDECVQSPRERRLRFLWTLLPVFVLLAGLLTDAWRQMHQSE